MKIRKFVTKVTDASFCNELDKMFGVMRFSNEIGTDDCILLVLIINDSMTMANLIVSHNYRILPEKGEELRTMSNEDFAYMVGLCIKAKLFNRV